MLSYDWLIVQNWVTWGYAKVDLAHRGVTFLRGENRDANGNSNFSGKSALMNALYAVSQGEHPQAQRKRSLSSVSRGDTRIAVGAHRGPERIVLDMVKGKTSISVGREDRRVAKKAAQREEVARIVGIPPELWACTVHVSGVDSNPLLSGTGATRCSFLEQAFELDRWERKGSLVAEKIASMKANQRELAELEREKSEMGPAPDAAGMKESVAKLDREVKRLESLLRDASQTVAKLDALPPHPGKSADDLRRMVRVGEEKLRAAEAAQADVERSADARAEWARYERERIRLEDEVRKYDNARDLDDANGRAVQAREELALATEYYDAEPLVAAWRSAASRVARKHGIRYANGRELLSLSTGWASILRAGSSDCPVCRGPLKSRVDSRDLDELRSALADLPVGIDPDARRPRYPLKSYEADYRDAKAELEEAEAAADAANALADLVESKPARPPSSKADAPNVAKIARLLSAAQEMLQRAEAWERSGLKPEQASRAGRLRERLPGWEDALSKARDSLASIRLDQQRCEEEAERRKRVADRIREVKRELEIEPVYRALQLAYSPTGLRMDRLSEVLETMVSNLNSGSYALRDRVSYGYKLSRNRDLSITATNVHSTYDVRFLSGAEKRVFALNLLLTLLRLLPSHRRTSLLVLDEMEANMSDATRSVFAEEIIPKLQEVVPSLWIVTPMGRDAFNVPGARNLTAVKRDGVSVLVDGLGARRSARRVERV